MIEKDFNKIVGLFNDLIDNTKSLVDSDNLKIKRNLIRSGYVTEWGCKPHVFENVISFLPLDKEGKYVKDYINIHRGYTFNDIWFGNLTFSQKRKYRQLNKVLYMRIKKYISELNKIYRKIKNKELELEKQKEQDQLDKKYNSFLEEICQFKVK